MYELEMNGQMVKFNFGMGFLREINKTVTVPVDGMKDMKQNVGLRYTVGRLNDYDVEALVEVLFMANKGCDPRITMDGLDAFINDENTDIDEVFEKTLGFLKKANATKNATLDVLNAIEKEKAKREAMEKMRMESMM
ncbi:tail assembly chaperone [Bariatricus sp. HCP3S3_E12]|uniref:tail assembly chaperone n=1 Tax=Bariatricus sp. HCP3S3_E12 TaxID=3438906 RepID=UPI003F8AB590